MTADIQGAASAGPPSKLVGLGSRRPDPNVLGEGGQGYVFALQDDPALVLKVFKRPTEQMSARMMALTEQGRRLSGTGPGQPVAWPVELIMNEDGEVGGYLMRRYGMPAHHRMEALFAPVTRKESFPQADWKFLAGVARNLSAIVAGLHNDAAEFVVGDLSPANVVVDAKGFVTLLDSDSMQFTDLRTLEVFPSALVTPNYAPPELQSREVDFPRSAYTDNFALAVMVLQLLLCGEHPFYGQPADGTEGQIADNIRESRSYLIGDGLVRLPPNALNAQVLPPEIQALAMNAFRVGRLDPRQRPTAQQWAAGLDAMIVTASKCAAGHAFKTSYGECPWCERLALRLPDPFGKKLPADYEASARIRASVAAAWSGQAGAKQATPYPGIGITQPGVGQPGAGQAPATVAVPPGPPTAGGVAYSVPSGPPQPPQPAQPARAGGKRVNVPVLVGSGILVLIVLIILLAVL
jgi:DNA-binding helix-hairpin-helix protein with protein kinase domain